jgi:hypothetical protein
MSTMIYPATKLYAGLMNMEESRKTDNNIEEENEDNSTRNNRCVKNNPLISGRPRA